MAPLATAVLNPAAVPAAAPSKPELPPVQLDPEANIQDWENKKMIQDLETRMRHERSVQQTTEDLLAGTATGVEARLEERRNLYGRDHASESKQAFPSGATMSPVDERFDLICPTGLRRLAARYALGAEKHGDMNWCKAVDDPAFQRARLNHLIKHVALYLLEGNATDDNLAAIAWGAFALMHYEEHCRHHEAKLPR